MRAVDWEDQLNACIEAWQGRAFAWGAADCCTWAAAAVEAQTGIDLMAEFRGAYKSKTGAARALRDIGAGTLVETMDAKLERIPPAWAKRGDVVMIDGNLGICNGRDALMIGDDGLERLPMGAATAAWGLDHG